MARRPPRRFHNYAEDRQCPDESENDPAPYPPEWTERERRVRPCDQKKDSAMIQHLYNAFCACLRPGMVKRGAEIQYQHRHRENDCADKETATASIARSQKQYRSAD